MRKLIIGTAAIIAILSAIGFTLASRDTQASPTVMSASSNGKSFRACSTTGASKSEMVLARFI